MDAVEFEDTRQKLYSRLPLVGARQRVQAAETLAAAAAEGNPYPARLLAEALVSHFDDKVQQLAFQGLQEIQQQRAVNAVCAVWEATRSPELAALIKERRWVANNPFGLRVLTALLARRTSIFEEDDPQMAVALIDACVEPDPQVAREASRALTLISDAGMRETICELITYRECPKAAVDAVINGGYAPSDKSMRALFYFVTGQAQQFMAMPEAQTWLQRAYDESDPKLKSRVLDRLRTAGRAEWVPWMYAEERLRNGVVTNIEWETSFDILRQNNAYDLLWRLARCCPPEMSAEILALLHERDYSSHEEDDWELLRELYRVRPMNARHGRLYLASPQAQATLLAGVPVLQDARMNNALAGYRTMVFTSDGRQIVTAGEELDLWQAWTGKRLSEMRLDEETPCSGVRLLAVSTDGVMLATCEDVIVQNKPISRVHLWALGDSMPVFVVEEDRGVGDMQFSPEGYTLAVTGLETTRLWDVREWKKVLLGELSGGVSCVRWWPRTRLLATAGPTGNVVLWDPAERKVRRTMQGKAPPVVQLHFSADGRHIATLHEDNSGRLWSLQEAACISVLRHQSGLRALEFSPDGTLLATGTGDGTLRLWQVDPFKLHVTLQRAAAADPRGVKNIAFSPDARRLASTSAGQDYVSLWSLTSNQRVAKCHPVWPQGVPPPASTRLSEPGEVRFSLTGDSMAARFGPIVQLWMITHPQPFGAMSAGDLRLADEMVGELEDDIDARAWKFASSMLRHRFARRAHRRGND
jgi:WD40 repeat protein